MAHVLRHRDFRLLWLGQATSLIGDQFAMIAMPWLAFIVMFLLGSANGYFVITTITLLQEGTPRSMLGRLMSLLLFASTGLLPLSEALSGAVSRSSLTTLFLGAGTLMLLVAAWMAFQPGFSQVHAVSVDNEIPG